MKEEDTHQPQTSRPACMDEHIMLILTDTAHTHTCVLTHKDHFIHCINDKILYNLYE